MSELAPSQTAAGTAGIDAGAIGITRPLNPSRHGAFLADVIVELGFADQATVEEAEQAARQSEQPFERFLLEHGILGEDQLSRAVAERNGLDHVDLDRFAIDTDVTEMISRSAAERYGAVPIAFAPDGALIVAVGDPLDSLGISDIEVMTKCEVRRVIATPSGVRHVIEQLPDEDRDARRPKPPPQAQRLDFVQAPVPATEPPPQPAPESEPEPEPPAAVQPEPQPESVAAESRLAELSEELRALQEEAARADGLAVDVGRRIEELEGAHERAERLEEELAAARERIGELEQRLSGVDTAVEDVRSATEKLSALRKALEASSHRQKAR